MGMQLENDNEPSGAGSTFSPARRHAERLLEAPGRETNEATLDEGLGVWRAFIQLLRGEEPVVRRDAPTSLRAPLEPSPEEFAGSLPERVGWLPAHAQNRDVYRFLSLQLAGRHEFGTYDAAALGGSTVARGGALYAKLRGKREQPSAVEEWFLLAEGVRVQARVEASYPGCVLDTRQLMAALLGASRRTPRAELTHGRVCDTLFACALAAPDPGLWRATNPPYPVPDWLPTSSVQRLLELVAPLRAADKSVADSLRIAGRLAQWAAHEATFRDTPEHAAEAELDEGSSLEPLGMSELASDGAALYAEMPASSVDDADADAGDDDGSESAAAQNTAEAPTGMAADGGATDEPPEDPRPLDLAARSSQRARAKMRRAQTFLYDEWDHTQNDYRRGHCLVHELTLQGDSGAFYERTTRSYAGVLTQVRKQFEHMRPERVRPLRGLEDGEDFDLNALTEARIDARAKRSPSTRIYTARTRQKRDVATLFLLDMSASTEQPFAEPGEPPPHRIIDTLKETLVVMCSALRALGDQYAIYGFSSQGRQKVEVFPIKSFGESFGPRVKARIGSIEPRHGTRMGAALRHVLRDFAHVQTRSKHLLLLSDGFPQDQDYGSDRRSHTYGIEDTAVALREVAAAGVTPLCITVDRAGQDYLRKMCSAGQYLVIDQLDELPHELPRIYRRAVAG